MKILSAVRRLAVDRHALRSSEAALPPENRATPHTAQPVLDPGAGAPGYGILARLHRPHVDLDGRWNADAVVAGAARHMRHLRARNQRLGRSAAVVDAGPAEMLALDETDAHAGAGEPRGQRRTGLAASNHNRVEVGHRVASDLSDEPQGRTHVPDKRRRAKRDGAQIRDPAQNFAKRQYRAAARQLGAGPRITQWRCAPCGPVYAR